MSTESPEPASKEYCQTLEKEINRLNEEVEEIQQLLDSLIENMILICEKLMEESK